MNYSKNKNNDDINIKNNKYPLSVIESNDYKYPSLSENYPKSYMSMIDSSNSTRYDTYKNSSARIKKKVEFHNYVKVINVKSYKKENRKNNYQNFSNNSDDDDIISENKCINCIIF